jgi:hypothetical protein
MLSEDLDGISLSGRLLDAEVDLSKMTLAELLEKCVLLQETARLSAVRVSENKSSFAVNRDLVLIL